MNSRIRSQLAAMMLLAPSAALLVAQPAVAQRAQAPTIATMSVNADHGLEAGSTLRFEVQARPGGSVDVVLGDSGVVVPLRERRGGLYQGNHVVRRADRIDPLQPIAVRATHGGPTIARNFNWPPAFQALAASADRNDRRESRQEQRADRREERREDRREARERRHDDRAPQITDMAPAHGDRIGEQGRTHLTAKLSDEGSGIDPASVRLRLAGRDVTTDARISENEVNYRADLQPGRYTVELAVKDLAGNKTTKTWTFDIVARERDRERERVGGADRERERVGGADRDRAGGDRLPLQITSHDNNARVDTGSLRLEGRTVPHAQVRVQVEGVALRGGLLGVAQPVLDARVQADANGRWSVVTAPSELLNLTGGHYDVRVTATNGHQTSEERIVLQRRS